MSICSFPAADDSAQPGKSWDVPLLFFATRARGSLSRRVKQPVGMGRPITATVQRPAITISRAFRDAEFRPAGKGLRVVSADMYLDGRVVFYVGNVTTPNFPYPNLGGGKFEEIGLSRGTSVNDRAYADGSMGVQGLDFNPDG